MQKFMKQIVLKKEWHKKNDIAKKVENIYGKG